MPKSSSNADQLAACTSVGVGEDECDEGRLVAILVGLKTIVNEFAAYDRLRTYQVRNPVLKYRKGGH